jgi:hypothetical protein
VTDVSPSPLARQQPAPDRPASPNPREVVILSWPAEAGLAAQLARQRLPRLLLVAPDATPPSDWDQLTDWIRLPADERDVEARVAALRRHAPPETLPTLDEFDVVRRGSRWIALAPIEARILAILLEHCGSVVPRRQLHGAWPHRAPGNRAVDARLTQLRTRIAVLGLHIHTVRSRGLFLEVAPAWRAGD